MNNDSTNQFSNSEDSLPNFSALYNPLPSSPASPPPAGSDGGATRANLGRLNQINLIHLFIGLIFAIGAVGATAYVAKYQTSSRGRAQTAKTPCTVPNGCVNVGTGSICPNNLAIITDQTCVQPDRSDGQILCCGPAPTQISPRLSPTLAPVNCKACIQSGKYYCFAGLTIGEYFCSDRPQMGNVICRRTCDFITPILSPSPTGNVCVQVITPARNSRTRECHTFPDACLPEGWVRDESCNLTPTTTSAPTSNLSPSPSPTSAIGGIGGQCQTLKFYALTDADFTPTPTPLTPTTTPTNAAPTSIPTSLITPSPTPRSNSRLSAVVQNQEIPRNQLKRLKSGDRFRIAAVFLPQCGPSGTLAPCFVGTKARIRVQSTAGGPWLPAHETSNRNQFGEFYIDYTIPPNQKTFVIEAQIFDKRGEWK